MSATKHSRILIARNGDGEGAEREVASLADKLDGGRIEEFRIEALALIERLLHARSRRSGGTGVTGAQESQKAEDAAPASRLRQDKKSPTRI